MTETEAKREVGANYEDEERIKRIKDKVDAIPIHSCAGLQKYGRMAYCVIFGIFKSRFWS